MILALALALTAIGYAIVEHRHQRARPRRRPRRRHRDRPAALRRGAAGRRPARLGRRAGLDPGLRRHAVRQLPRGLPRRRSPALADEYARPGDAKLLISHYSVAQNPLELGFFGAEAAAEQGYGWQYTYLFFRNQDEAERFGVGEEFMDSLAGAIGNLNVPEWEEYLEEQQRQPAERSRPARRLRRARHRSRHPHPAGDDRQRPRAAPAPCRTAPRWPRSNARSGKSAARSGCGRSRRPH